MPKTKKQTVSVNKEKKLQTIFTPNVIRAMKDDGLMFESTSHFNGWQMFYGGTAPKFTSPKALAESIVIWAQERAEMKMPLTISGLALFLGCDPDTLRAYQNGKLEIYDGELSEQFSKVVKEARTTVIDRYEQNLHKTSAGGSIFALKNFGWSDERTIHGNINHIFTLNDVHTKLEPTEESTVSPVE